jgi:predicted transcriptional regulator
VNDDVIADLNIRIRNLPKETNRLLDLIATARQRHKYEIVKEALEEFAERHKGEVTV